MLRVLILLACVLSCVARAADTQQSSSSAKSAELQKLALEVLNQMEKQADEARRAYWQGHYAEALKVFQDLSAEVHPSSALYLREKAMCQIALGQYDGARQSLRQASAFSELHGDAELEKKAVSAMGKEGEKIYYGDPYERAVNYLLQALLYLEKGDEDNALAVCKSGLLADSDASENHYESDFTLLYLISAKCYQLRNQADQSESSIKQARQSYQTTHPDVRNTFNDRLYQTELLKMSKSERRKLKIKDDDAAIQARIASLENDLKKACEKVNPDKDLGPLITGDYNTLVVVARGQGPGKIRMGQEADLVRFDPHHLACQTPAVLLDGKPVQACLLTNVSDVEFQAVTRGGRQMDAILHGKAVTKQTTVAVGAGITEVGTQTGGIVGMGIALVGVAVQAAGSAITPEADTRCWKCLPAEFDIIAVKLPPGEHEASFSQFTYFERASIQCKFKVPETGVAVVFAPPSLAAKYSDQAQQHMKSLKLASTNAAGTELLVPLPLGLRKIDKFPGEDQNKHPRGFAPDPRQLGRQIRDTLKPEGVHCVLVEHDEIIQDRAQAAGATRLALQTEFVSVDLKVQGKEELCSAKFSFSLVDVQTGDPVCKKELEGTYTRKAGEKTEYKDAFYKCAGVALGAFVKDPEFSESVKKYASVHQP